MLWTHDYTHHSATPNQQDLKSAKSAPKTPRRALGSLEENSGINTPLQRAKSVDVKSAKLRNKSTFIVFEDNVANDAIAPESESEIPDNSFAALCSKMAGSMTLEPWTETPSIENVPNPDLDEDEYVDDEENSVLLEEDPDVLPFPEDGRAWHERSLNEIVDWYAKQFTPIKEAFDEDSEIENAPPVDYYEPDVYCEEPEDIQLVEDSVRDENYHASLQCMLDDSELNEIREMWGDSASWALEL